MKKKILNAVRNFSVALLCVFLVFLLVVTPFYYSVTALTKPETIVKIVQDIDYKKLTQESKVIKNVFKSVGVAPEKADEIIKSETAGKLIEVYADEAVELLADIPKGKEWSIALLKDIVEDNIGRITEIAEETTGKSVSQNLLHAKINSTLSGSEGVIEEATPVINRVRMVVETVKGSKLLKRSMTPAFALLLGAVLLVCCAAIVLLRRKNLMGIFLLALCFILAAGLLAAIVAFSQGGFVKELAKQMSDFGAEIVLSAVEVCVDNLIIALLICCGVSVALSATFISIYIMKHKRMPSPDEAELPAEELNK